MVDTAYRITLAQRAGTSHVQALHHGAQLPAWSGATVDSRQHLRFASQLQALAETAFVDY